MGIFRNVEELRKSSASMAVKLVDGCTYTYWDAEAETGQEAKGAIVTEVVENRRIYFGDPNDSQVQTQPWIIIEKRETVRKVSRRAKANGIKTWAEISADDEVNGVDDVKRVDDKCTVLLMLWRDEDSGEIWAYEFTQHSAVSEPKNLGLRLYLPFSQLTSVDMCTPISLDASASDFPAVSLSLLYSFIWLLLS